MAQRGWKIDLNKCIGCHSCTVACKSELNTPIGVDYRTVVFRESGVFPNVRREFITTACNHCIQPACMKACPVQAISKRQSDGVVLLDHETCVGCKNCAFVCPYGAPRFNEETNKMEKCTFCVHRIDAGLEPACKTTCVGEAIEMVEDFVANTGYPEGFASPKLTEPSIGFVLQK